MSNAINAKLIKKEGEAPKGALAVNVYGDIGDGGGSGSSGEGELFIIDITATYNGSGTDYTTSAKYEDIIEYLGSCLEGSVIPNIYLKTVGAGGVPFTEWIKASVMLIPGYSAKICGSKSSVNKTYDNKVYQQIVSITLSIDIENQTMKLSYSFANIYDGISVMKTVTASE